MAAPHKHVQHASQELFAVARGDSAAHRHLRERVLGLLWLTIAIDVLATLIVFVTEHRASGTQIHNLWDAFLFTTGQLVTASSVAAPTTSVGKVLEIFFDLYAITVVAALAGSFGAFFHRISEDRREAEQKAAAAREEAMAIEAEAAGERDVTSDPVTLGLSAGVLGISGHAAVRPAGTLRLAPARPLLTARSLRAAYETDGSVARDTLRLWGREQTCPDPVPDAVAPGDVYHVIEEEVVWGGFLGGHFGHFLVEQVSRLWPLLPGGPLEGRSVVFATPDPLPWVAEWLEAFGVEVFDTPAEGLVRFTAMHVPEPALQVDNYGAPELRDIHRHARTRLDVPARDPQGLVWLSRTSLPANRRVRDEALVERVLEGHAEVARLETLTLGEQVGVLESAETVAGISGSAFHALLLAETAPVSLQFCTSRIASPFVVQDAIVEGETVFVPTVAADPTKQTESGRPNPHRLLVPETIRAIAALAPIPLLEDALPEAAAHPERQWSAAEPASPGPEGMPEPIERALARVVLDPHNASARMILGALLEGEGRVDDALEQYAAVAELDPGYVYGRVRTARMLWLAGRKEEALEAARRVLELEPGNEEAARYLAAQPG